jgi:aspartate carbamoyltransferase catalytic subunit
VDPARHLLRIDHITDAAVVEILEGARRMQQGAPAPGPARPVIALLFLSPSLRTRIGFATAAARLGGTALDVSEARSTAQMSAPESFDDTLRTLSGMVDLVVVRTPFDLDIDRTLAIARAPVVNGGDGQGGHPTQALIDLFAIEELVGPIGEQHLVISGDLTMRATRSLLRLLSRFPPHRLTLLAPPSRSAHGVRFGAELAQRTSTGDRHDLAGADVLYLPGLPATSGDDHLDADARKRYAFDAEAAAILPGHATVLSPLPVVDEVHDDVRGDLRVRMFDQSDLAVPVRASILAWSLASVAV